MEQRNRRPGTQVEPACLSESLWEQHSYWIHTGGRGQREGGVLSSEDSKGWGLPNSGWLLSPWIIHQSSVLRAGSFLCVVHLVRDSCLPRGHKREDLDPPAHKHSSETLSAPLLWGLKAILIPRGRQGSDFCLCACVHTTPPPPSQTHTKLHTCDMKSWYSWNCFSFLSIVPSFP